MNIKSGKKYLTFNGISAIKDGIKENNFKKLMILPKPYWIRIKQVNSILFYKIKNYLLKYKLNTVCEEAKCPNINECWSNGTMTIMLMGSVCTRSCSFCSIDTGNPKKIIDIFEPRNVAKVISFLNMKYIVLTSVTRDDLRDGGLKHFIKTIKFIKAYSPDIRIEVLSPDFSKSIENIKQLVNSGIHVFSQNIETVKRLTRIVRDNRSNYINTLNALSYAKKYNPDILTKSSIMLGLGESYEEVIETMNDLRKKDVNLLTLGQYLQPTKNHLPVVRYVKPEEFNKFKKIGLEKGFLEVESGPLVRSSYNAGKVFEKNYLSS
ncbi:lipoyl synthase [Candidatus Legionella polyplacis]|uniref:lipoyl synthase n=1 Tax=Candidatus Legionella polyplacis TaxID=2005262 RepID=UPI000C1DF0A2|nr:lipoyl synthase [Candidatus Legionella polyplacis]ATW01657.1 lipoyl synthase [Candidatus Legionella polyplacis]